MSLIYILLNVSKSVSILRSFRLLQTNITNSFVPISIFWTVSIVCRCYILHITDLSIFGIYQFILYPFFESHFFKKTCLKGRFHQFPVNVLLLILPIQSKHLTLKKISSTNFLKFLTLNEQHKIRTKSNCYICGIKF